MSSKAQANSNDKSPLGHQAVQPEAQSTASQDQSIVPARVVQKARTASRLLTSHDLLQLQRSIGNQAVNRLLAPTQSPHQQSPASFVVQRLPKFKNQEEAIIYFEDTMLDDLENYMQDLALLKQQASRSGWEDLLDRISYHTANSKPVVAMQIESLDLTDPDNFTTMKTLLLTVQKNGWDDLEDKLLPAFRKLEDSRPGELGAVPEVGSNQVVVRSVSREDVEEIENYLPFCVENLDPSRKAYKRNNGEIKEGNDTDLFYADGTGPLVPITIAMVNEFFDARYPGFQKISGPDRTKNCEDYAKAYAGFRAKTGNYSNSQQLIPLISNQGLYVLELGDHWMSVDNTNGSSITIRQKDAESAVYQKTYDSVQAAATYILSKHSSGGSVYATR